MSNLKQISQNEFEAEVIQSDLPVVVDFYADWCAPCRQLGPILDRLSAEFSGQIKFVKINCDDEQELAAAFEVTGLPTLAFIDQGQRVGQFAGLPPESELRLELQNWLSERASETAE
jgi:thioredoxin